MLSAGRARARFAAFIATGAVAALAAPAGAATTIGEVGSDPEDCSSNFVWNQVSSLGPASYTMPSAGVLTSWSHNAVAFPGQELSLLVFRPAGLNLYRLVGKSARENIQASQLNSFPTRIPVGAGDTLGLRVATAAGCLTLTGPGDLTVQAAAHEPAIGADTVLSNEAPGRLNVSALLEPDVDGDGYGDETQDTGPATTVSKAPKKKTHSARAKIKFSADQEGVKFACVLDRKKLAKCGSPLKLKKLEAGKHKLTITGTDAAGFTGPPTVVGWKVLGG